MMRISPSTSSWTSLYLSVVVMRYRFDVMERHFYHPKSKWSGKSWRRLERVEQVGPNLQSQDEQDFYAMNETGVLEFSSFESVKEAEEGFWMRGRFIVDGEGQLENLPSLPP